MEYSKYILTKVLKGDELEKVERELRIREEMGRRAIRNQPTRPLRKNLLRIKEGLSISP